MLVNVLKNLNPGVAVRNIIIVGLTLCCMWLYISNHSLESTNIALAKQILDVSSQNSTLTVQNEAFRQANEGWKEAIQAQTTSITAILEQNRNYAEQMQVANDNLAKITKEYADRVGKLRAATIPDKPDQTLIWLKEQQNSSLDWPSMSPTNPAGSKSTVKNPQKTPKKAR